METNLDGRRGREEVAVAAGAGEETLLGFCPAQARGSAAYIALGPADAGSIVGPGRRPASPKIPWPVDDVEVASDDVEAWSWCRREWRR